MHLYRRTHTKHRVCRFYRPHLSIAVHKYNRLDSQLFVPQTVHGIITHHQAYIFPRDILGFACALMMMLMIWCLVYNIWGVFFSHSKNEHTHSMSTQKEPFVRELSLLWRCVVESVLLDVFFVCVFLCVYKRVIKWLCRGIAMWWGSTLTRFVCAVECTLALTSHTNTHSHKVRRVAFCDCALCGCAFSYARIAYYVGFCECVGGPLVSAMRAKSSLRARRCFEALRSKDCCSVLSLRWWELGFFSRVPVLKQTMKPWLH